LLPDVGEESVAGPATEQHDGVHRYTVEIHPHGRQRAKGVESDALRVEAQAFEIDAGDEISEYPQGGCEVKIAGTSVVALEFVDKIRLGSALGLEPADHGGADNYRAISTGAGEPLGHCVVAFVTLVVLESDQWSRLSGAAATNAEEFGRLFGTPCCVFLSDGFAARRKA